MEAEGRLPKCANSHRSSMTKKQASHLPCCETDGSQEDKSKINDGQNINTRVPCNTPILGNTLPEGQVEEDSFRFALHGKIEDTDESDWEDGYIPISDSRDPLSDGFARELVLEFSDLPSSSKQISIRRASAEDRELAELVHKAHLLCLIARGRLVDRACSDPLIQASLLSLLPTHLLKVAEVPKLTTNALTPLVYWFHENFCVRSPSPPERSFKSSLVFALENREGTAEEVVALSVALFRALNMTTRFVSILDVVSLKPGVDVGCSIQDAIGVETNIFNSSTLTVTRPSPVSVSSVQSSSHKIGFNKNILHGSSRKGASQIRENDLTSKIGQPTDLNDRVLGSLACKARDDNSEAFATKKAEWPKRKGDLEFELQLEMAISATAAEVHDSNLSSEAKDLPSSSDFPSPLKKMKRIKTENSPVSSQGIATAVGSRKVGPPLCWAEVFCSGENLTGKWVHVDVVNAIIDGEEKVEAAAAACRRSLRYVVAFAGHGAKDVTRRYCTKWYKIASKRINSHWWDAVLAPLKELESGATGGMVHLEARPENDSIDLEKVKTFKMCDSSEASGNQNFKSSTQESLPGNASFTEKISLEVSKPHMNIISKSSTRNSGVATRNSLEDMELQTRALTEPLPTNQQAYKNHNLYAIERWLSKYQILHPKGPILGYCSGHPVYPRTCVQILQTKERWFREGLQVKENESPAKVVKRVLKLGRLQSSEPGVYDEDDGERTIALFGKWQMEPLNLPHAVNGIVPKNERGQVDVWSEKCLPPGTVHLRLPRVVPVAKRLQIDFAPAMVGFEFRNGRSVPVFEGIVVCTEFRDAIMEAYGEEEERREAEEKKRTKAQAISRWYQLLSSILTRQRLNNTYGDGSSSQTAHHLNRKDDVCGSEVANRWNNSQSQECCKEYASNSNISSIELTEDHEHIFPIEDQSFNEESSVRTKRCPCGFSVQVEEF